MRLAAVRPAALRLALAGALLAAPGASARAEEPATHDLSAWRTTWAAGATRTVSAKAEMRGTVTATQVDQASGLPQTFEQNLLELEEYSYVQRCEAADAKGEASAFRVFVAAWSMQDQEEGPDASLTGVHVEVTVKDGAYAWKLLNAPAEPSRLAKKWLDKRFGAERDGDEGLDLAKLGRPPGPLALGGTWAGNLKFLDDEMPVVAERSSVTLTLADVREARARIPVKVHLQLQGFPLGDGPEATLLPWTEGGALEGAGETWVPLAAGSHDAENAFEGTMKGKAQSDVLTVALSVSMTGKAVARTGGVIPEMKPVEPRFGTQPAR